MKDFFISYSHGDSQWADWICWQLDGVNYTYIRDKRDFGTGENIHKHMYDASLEAERVMVLLSPRSLASRAVWDEISSALYTNEEGQPSRFVPVLIDKDTPLGILSGRKYINLAALNEDQARAKLLADLMGPSEATTRPEFPGIAEDVAKEPPGRRFPGALPPVWNVPHSRNRNFTGREEHLARLESALSSGKVGVISQAMHGLGGIGKTQIALEYVYRHCADYEIVWWMRSELAPTLRDDYASLGAELKLPGIDPMNQPEAIEAVRRELGRRRGWLLVFDNVCEPSDIADLIPEGGKGHVIATSRNPSFRGIAQPIKVKEFEPDKSVEFIGKRTGREDDAGFRELSRELGDFPLALEQAAAYLEETGCSASDYLDLFRKRQKELLERCSNLDPYEKSVATTWEITSEKFKEERPVAAELMNLFAFFAPDRIPLDVIR